MQSTLTFQQTSANFVPAALRHDSNGWYITYYAFNTLVNKLERKRLKLNLLRRRCRNVIEFKMQVSDIMHTIDSHLQAQSQITEQFLAATKQPMMQPMEVYQPAMQPMTVMQQTGQPVVVMQAGFPTVYQQGEPVQQVMAAPIPTPEVEQPKTVQKAIKNLPNTGESVRYYKSLDEVTKIYVTERSKELREQTMRSYKSFCKMLREWANENYPGIKCSQFGKPHAVEFLDAMAAKNLGPSTYNNMIRLSSVFFLWCKTKCYARENPFEGQKRKRVLEKTRTIIKPEDQVRIDKWFEENLPEMRIVSRLIYTSLLRPIEITRIQVKQLDFEKHCIVMPKEKTKTWEAREGRMDAELEEMLRKHVQGAKPDDYLFADSLWRCGKRSMGNGTYGKAWDRMRKALKLPAEYQLYSLKDTAINSMLKAGVDDLSVMQAAGHKDLSMTTIYANHHDDKLISNLNQVAPRFAQ